VRGGINLKDAAWHREYQRRRYAATWRRAVAFLGGCCVVCGSRTDLQFDHRDPTTKQREVTRMFSKYSWARILEELAKCQLLCRPHHVDKTMADRGLRRLSA